MTKDNVMPEGIVEDISSSSTSSHSARTNVDDTAGNPTTNTGRSFFAGVDGGGSVTGGDGYVGGFIGGGGGRRSGVFCRSFRKPRSLAISQQRNSQRANLRLSRRSDRPSQKDSIQSPGAAAFASASVDDDCWLKAASAAASAFDGTAVVAAGINHLFPKNPKSDKSSKAAASAISVSLSAEAVMSVDCHYETSIVLSPPPLESPPSGRRCGGEGEL